MDDLLCLTCPHVYEEGDPPGAQRYASVRRRAAALCQPGRKRRAALRHGGLLGRILQYCSSLIIVRERDTEDSSLLLFR